MTQQLKQLCRKLAGFAGLTLLVSACGGGGGGSSSGSAPAASPALAAAPSTAAAAALPIAAPVTAPTTTPSTAPVAVLVTAATAAPAPTPTPVSNALVASTPIPATDSVQSLLTIDVNNLINYAPVMPKHYDAQVLARDTAQVSKPFNNAQATLGRVLFYDRELSINNSINCASCHIQSRGFGDKQQFSFGFTQGLFTSAQSMRLSNMRYWSPGTAFWNQRAESIEAQASQPIQNSIEMGFDAGHGGITNLLTRLASLRYYQDLFTLAFGDAAVTEDRLQRALGQFQRAMVSSNSRWDTAYAQVYDPALPDKGLSLNLPSLTAAENRGRQLFMTAPAQGGAGCAACHQPPTFTLAPDARGNGLVAGDKTLFKPPSLKNAALSNFFMHDGRLSSLDQVVEHYNSGVQPGPALDTRLLANGAPQRLNLPDSDKTALVAFLKTLTDSALTTDLKFSTPFRQ
jgi:cytochrome c peroxidase